MNATHMRLHVIRPTLKAIGLWSENAEELLMGTAAHESHMGKYARQVNGPALGAFQMEPSPHTDIYDNFLRYKPDLLRAVQDTIPIGAESRTPAGYKCGSNAMLTHNPCYAALMARLHYLRQPGKVPDSIEGQGQYWKKYYNTAAGKGTVEQYLDDYVQFVGSE